MFSRPALPLARSRSVEGRLLVNIIVDPSALMTGAKSLNGVFKGGIIFLMATLAVSFFTAGWPDAGKAQHPVNTATKHRTMKPAPKYRGSITRP